MLCKKDNPYRVLYYLRWDEAGNTVAWLTCPCHYIIVQSTLGTRLVILMRCLVWYMVYTHYFRFIVMENCLWNNGWICSWNQPVLSNKDRVSCWICSWNQPVLSNKDKVSCWICSWNQPVLSNKDKVSCWICSWNQPVLSNKDKVSCQRKQQGPWWD